MGLGIMTFRYNGLRYKGNTRVGTNAEARAFLTSLFTNFNNRVLG